MDHLPGLRSPHPSSLRNDSMNPNTINLHAEDPFLVCLQHPSHICFISYRKKILWPSSLPVLFSRQRWSSISGASGQNSSPDLCCLLLSRRIPLFFADSILNLNFCFLSQSNLQGHPRKFASAAHIKALWDSLPYDVLAWTAAQESCSHLWKPSPLSC